jgi:signal transduction histidine kinase
MRRAAALGRLAVADPAGWIAAREQAFARDGADSGEVALSNGRTLWVQRRRLDGDETVEIVIDVTERALRESELTDARNRAEAASRAKSSFLSVMSHELRTPLNGAIGLAGLLGTEPLTERQRRLVEMIVESGGTLLRILSDMLDLAALEQASVALEIAPTDVAALAMEAAGPARRLAERKGLEFRADVAAVEGVRVMADARRVAQILGALLDNAVKFTDRGRVTLSAAARRDEDGRIAVRFTVTDTGVGVSDTAREHLFDVFAQADGSATRRFGGVGAGLTICRGLVELMGGTIEVDSAPGAGSAFTVRLTLDEPDAAPVRSIA